MSRYNSTERIVIQLKPLLVFYSQPKHKQRLSQLCTYEVLKGLHILLDILSPCHSFQLRSQQRNITLPKIVSLIEDCLSKLQYLKSNIGAREGRFDSEYDVDSRKFKDFNIKHTARMSNSVVAFKKSYINCILAQLTARLTPMKRTLSNFDFILNINDDMSHTDILESITKFCDTFKFFKFSSNELFEEYISYRTLLDSKPSLDTFEKQYVYLHKHCSELAYLGKAYRFLMLAPVTTVVCESSFSHMASIKTKSRSCLNPSNLENLMFLALYSNFNFDYTIASQIIVNSWNNSS